MDQDVGPGSRAERSLEFSSVASVLTCPRPVFCLAFVLVTHPCRDMHPLAPAGLVVDSPPLPVDVLHEEPGVAAVLMLEAHERRIEAVESPVCVTALPVVPLDDGEGIRVTEIGSGQVDDDAFRLIPDQ